MKIKNSIDEIKSIKKNNNISMIVLQVSHLDGKN